MPETPRFATRHAVFLATALFLVVGLTLLLWPTPRSTPYPPACTTTIDPTGSVQGWLASATPGKVLCLKSGTYTGGERMLFVNSAQGGSQSQPLWIRAETEGTVLVDGQFGQRPLDCLGHDVVFWGLNLKDGNDSVLVLRGQRCQAKRLVAYSTAASWGLDNVVDLGGTYNLLEDVSAWGYARKIVASGARGGTSHNVIRRVFAEHSGFIPTQAGSGNPTNTGEVG